jgi:hypothetical protein
VHAAAVVLLVGDDHPAVQFVHVEAV